VSELEQTVTSRVKLHWSLQQIHDAFTLTHSSQRRRDWGIRIRAVL